MVPVVITGIRLGISDHASSPVGGRDGEPAISVNPASLDFGEAWVTDRFQWTIPIRNAGSAAVEIAGIRAGCGCTDVEPKRLVIPAGQSRELVASIDLRKALRNDDASTTPFDVNIEGTLAPNGELVQWRLRGIVKRGATVDPPALYLGSRSRLAPQFESRLVEITFHRPVTNVHAEAAEPVVAVDVVAFDRASQRATLRVTPKATEEGPFATRVVIAGDSDESVMAIPVELPVSGAVGTDVVASPAAILYGIVEPGTQCEARVSLRSHTGSRFSVENVRTSTDSTKVVREMKGASEENAGQRGSVYVMRDIVETVGFHGSTVIFEIRCEDDSLERIEVPTRYIGRPRVHSTN